MEADWKCLLQLEQSVANAKMVRLDLLEDLKCVLTPVVRLIFAAYEESGFLPCPAGHRLLKGLLEVLPDSKIVEDCHGALRLHTKRQQNRRTTLTAMQDCLMTSGVLDSRGIPNPAVVDRATFLTGYSRTRLSSRKKRLEMMLVRSLLSWFLVRKKTFLNLGKAAC